MSGRSGKEKLVEDSTVVNLESYRKAQWLYAMEKRAKGGTSFAKIYSDVEAYRLLDQETLKRSTDICHPREKAGGEGEDTPASNY